MKSMPVSEESMKEVFTLDSISNPYIVKYIDSFVEREILYLVTEYCEKGTLSTFISNQLGVNLTEDKIWRIALEILAGLAELSKKNIIHRNLKPSTIYLTRNFNAKISDFSRSICPKGKNIKELRRIENPVYDSPEICRGDFYSTKTDVWSLGCILYELCTLNPAYGNFVGTQMMEKIFNRKLAPIPSIYSKNLSFLIAQCMIKDSSQRPSAGELLKIACKLSKYSSHKQKSNRTRS